MVKRGEGTRTDSLDDVCDFDHDGFDLLLLFGKQIAQGESRKSRVVQALKLEDILENLLQRKKTGDPRIKGTILENQGTPNGI